MMDGNYAWALEKVLRFAPRAAIFKGMQKVIDYLRANQARFVRELCDYVRFPSVSAQPQHRDDMKACARNGSCSTQKASGLEAKLLPDGRPSDRHGQNAARRKLEAPAFCRLRTLRRSAGRAAGIVEVAAV